jgi:2-methylisocitrate lyase-like PEP mutase family enzyme
MPTIPTTPAAPSTPTRPTIADKAERFRELHQRPGTFIIPNPFDIGSARILQSLGFEALATTSSGFAFTMGRRDYEVSRDEAIAHSKALVDATDIPVSADLENGFGDDPDTVAETVRLAADAGLAGCSIEDSTQRESDPIYAMEHAVDRIRAAVAAARSGRRPFTLTARAENHLHGRPDLKDTIARLQAFQGAGADVLYAPGLTSIDDVRTLIANVDRPVNVLAGMQRTTFTLTDLASVGTKRISVGGAMSRVALAAVIRAGREMSESGAFTFVNEPITSREIGELFRS